LEKVTRLGELATAIAHHPLLKDALALKGGTAFNLCFGTAPARLSVDLDYNYIGHVEREAMLADRPRIEEAVVAVVQRLGFDVQQSADSFAGRKLYAGYRSVLGPPSRVEVDLNYLWRVPLHGVTERELWQPGELDRPRVLTVSILELCVGKLLAFMDRSAARDAWDVERMPTLTQEILWTPLFRALFIALSVTLPHPLSNYKRKHIEERLTTRMIQEQLLPMLAVGRRLDKEELIERAWRVVAPSVELTPNEQEYIKLINDGIIRPELLFPDQHAFAQRIAGHPAILWKVANVLQERKKRG
ncbi:MAG: nucleotidyl transferase AbiEii/AbiGii toxin family protein, partial [Candidatus Hydrogenedentes bacterium]|nr:nucleotidyl transferase AbiEii/AbiGii toxin family protein [Candidatus Hydrogenedentota bacterium]